jgi:hypothetical protein
MKIACDVVQGILTVIMSCVSRNRLETIKRMMTRSEKMFCTFSYSNGQSSYDTMTVNVRCTSNALHCI